MLNTVYAGALASSLAARPGGTGPDLLAAGLDGYHRAFLVGAGFLAAAALSVAVLVRNRRDEPALSTPGQ